MSKLLTVIIVLLSLITLTAKDVAFLGVSTKDIPVNQYINYGITDGYGILINTVIKNSAAEEADLKKGMVLRKLDNEKLYTRNQLQRMLEGRKIDEKITLSVIDDKKEKEITLKLGKRVVFDNESSAWLGVHCIEAENSDDFTLNYGLLVKDVTKDSPAEKAGLISDDILLTFKEDKLYSVDQLRHILKTCEPEEKVNISFWRDGKNKKIEVELGARSINEIFGDDLPQFYGLFDDLDIDIDLGDLYSTWNMMGLPGKVHIYSFPDSTRKLMGVIVTSLSDDKLKELKIDNGVLVKSTVEESSAEEAGIENGDIIIEVNGIKIKEKTDISDALENIEIGDKFEVKIIRIDKPMTIDITLKEAPQDLSNIYNFSFDDDHSIEMMFDDDTEFFFDENTQRDSLDCLDQEEYKFQFLKKGSKGPL